MPELYIMRFADKLLPGLRSTSVLCSRIKLPYLIPEPPQAHSSTRIHDLPTQDGLASRWG